jgi:hypothetical protein
MAASFREVARAEVAQLRRRESEISARRYDLSQPPTDPSDLADIAQRFDSAYNAVVGSGGVGGGGAPAPLPNESRFSYRRRLAGGLQRFSDSWRQADLYRLGNDTMTAAEAQILSDVAAVVADKTVPNSDGSLRAIVSNDISGRQITDWAGSPLSWMSRFMSKGQTVKRFKDPVTGATLRPGARRSI